MTRFNLPAFTPHAGQAAILGGVALRNVACMGRRFGKTFLLPELIVNGKKRLALGAGKPTDALHTSGAPCP